MLRASMGAQRHGDFKASIREMMSVHQLGAPWSREDFMRRAIEIAENGRGKVQPNLVGCVLVRDGKVIAEGWHDNIGGFHAEQAAIADAEERGIATSGSTAYVTLEPCNHHGRTPPCTEALLWAGIDRVVIRCT